MTARHADGELQPALEHLHDALADLIEPRIIQLDDGTTRTGPSLYMQLFDTITLAGHRGAPCSRPPIWIDAFDLRTEIDERIALEQPAYTGSPPTVGRLHHIAARNFRPQDTHWIQSFTSVLESWTRQIGALLDPQAVKHVSAACPACGAVSVVRRDSAGEYVRAPAMQIVTDIGCQCQNCKTSWGPQLYPHLAAVIGCDPLTGVLQ